jgi:hypothetical protein
MLSRTMHLRWLVVPLALLACSKLPPPSGGTPDPNQPGGTGVDEHGVLLRSKPDANGPEPDPKLVADDDSNLLFYAGASVGDPALQRRTWVQLGLADGSGNPTPKMSEFLRAHQVWVRDRASLAATVATPEKARAYLEAHLK